jgi:hypothetical protein
MNLLETEDEPPHDEPTDRKAAVLALRAGYSFRPQGITEFPSPLENPLFKSELGPISWGVPWTSFNPTQHSVLSLAAYALLFPQHFLMLRAGCAPAAIAA